MNLVRESGVDHVELATGVDLKSKWAGLIDLHGNDQQGPGDNSRSQADNVTGAMRFGLSGYGCERQRGGEKDAEGVKER